MRVNEKRVCALGVSRHPRVINNLPAVIIELASQDLKPRAVPLGHVAGEVNHIRKNVAIKSVLKESILIRKELLHKSYLQIIFG